MPAALQLWPGAALGRQQSHRIVADARRKLASSDAIISNCRIAGIVERPLDGCGTTSL